MQIPIEGTPQNRGGYIPEQVYRVRCVDTKFSASNNSGRPMTTLSCEIIEPETVEVEGTPTTVAGRPFSLFLIHNTEKSGWGTQGEVLEFCAKLGIEFAEGFYDTDEHETYFKGMEFDIILRAKEEVKRYTAGTMRGEPLLDGEGNQIKSEMRINARPSDLLENCHPWRNEAIASNPY